MRGEAAAIASTFTRPRGLSIWTSSPIGRERSVSRSSCVSSWSTKWTSAAVSTFGIITQSSAAPARGTTWSEIAEAPRRLHPVHAHDLRPGRPGPDPAAPGRRARASRRSSRAARRRPRGRRRPGRQAVVAAFASIFSLEPGTARQERRRRTGLPANLADDLEELDAEAVRIDHVHGEPSFVRPASSPAPAR